MKFIVFEIKERATPEAIDAMLKPFEKPLDGYRLAIVTSDLERIPKTLRSRTLLVRYYPLPESIIKAKLEELFDSDEASLYARLASGSLERAMDLCGGGRLALRDEVLDALDAARARHHSRLFAFVDAWKDQGSLKTAAFLLGQILVDSSLARLSPSRMKNLDQVERIEKLRTALSRASAEMLAQRVAGTNTDRGPHEADLQLKAALLTAFR
jgi:DNA polymerase III delta prime subunit